MGVFPADHVITKPKKYAKLLKPAFKAADAGNIAVLGIRTAMGRDRLRLYRIRQRRRGRNWRCQKVLSFREKPDAKTAKQFVAARRFFWNAGMFFWKASTVLEALRQHQPKTWTLLAALPALGKRDFAAQVAESFPRCENISIDYAVLEKAKNVVGMRDRRHWLE